MQQEITDGAEAHGQKAPLTLSALGEASPESQGSSPATPLWGSHPHLASKSTSSPKTDGMISTSSEREQLPQNTNYANTLVTKMMLPEC